MPDPLQGMATAFVEEALSPGGSLHHLRAPEPNIHLPQPISQLEPSSFIGRTLYRLSKGDPDSSDSNSLSEGNDAPPCAGPSKPHCHCAKRSKRSFLSSPSSLSSSDSEGAGGPGGSPSPSDSDSSSSDSSESSLHGHCHHHQKHCHGSKKRHSSRKCSKHSKLHVPVLKPLDPEPYEGEVDLPRFHRFIGQMSDYLEGYHVRLHNHPSMVACFL